MVVVRPKGSEQMLTKWDDHVDDEKEGEGEVMVSALVVG